MPATPKRVWKSTRHGLTGRGHAGRGSTSSLGPEGGLEDAPFTEATGKGAGIVEKVSGSRSPGQC